MKELILKSTTILPLSLIGITAISGGLLRSTIVKADVDDEITITVSQSCTMTGSGMTSHTAEIANGQYNSAIGTTNVNVTCNDGAGFAVYAIGYTGNTLGNNKLTSSVLGTAHDIVTGTGLSGNSQWAMKLATVTDPAPTYPIIIAGSSADSDENNTTDFSSFQQVPDDYTKVAYRATGTDVGTGATGANFTTTYQAYISTTQAAGTYTGKVKYVLVHPNTAPAPTLPPAPQASCNTPFPASTGITYMQQINSTNRTAVLAALTQDQHYYLRDSRDEEPYCVVKLADGNLWLADNLRLDLTDDTILASMNETNTNASNTTLGYLKGTTTRDPSTDASGQYATAKVANWTSSNSYSAPLVNLTNNDVVPTDATSTAGGYKVGGYYNYCAASAGSYCYGNGDTSYGTPSGNATEDICPKNWRMPTGNSGGEYGTLYSNSNYNTVAKYRSALRLPLSGYFNNGSAASQGSSGVFWSSTRYGDNYMYTLYVDTGNVNPPNINYRNRGDSVRCLLSS